MSNKEISLIQRPRSLCDIAVESIRDAIVNGTYELGESLSEAGLVKVLGISKTPIREAISILKLEGLIVVVPQKGTFVFTMSANEVAKLGHYRFALESTAVDMAMKNNSEELASKLLRICGSMEKARAAKKMKDYLELDTKFHDTLFEYTDNSYLADGYKMVVGKIAALRTHLSQHPTHTEKSFAEHRKIAENLKEGKIKEAKTILKRHVTRGERSYAESVSDIAEEDKSSSTKGNKR